MFFFNRSTQFSCRWERCSICFLIRFSIRNLKSTFVIFIILVRIKVNYSTMKNYSIFQVHAWLFGSFCQDWCWSQRLKSQTFLLPGTISWAIIPDYTCFFYFETTDFLLNEHTYIFCVFVFIKSVERGIKRSGFRNYNKKITICLSFFLVNQIVFISSYLRILFHKIDSSWVILSILPEKQTIFRYRRDVMKTGLRK